MHMEKEEKDQDVTQDEIVNMGKEEKDLGRLMRLSSSFSRQTYICYSTLRVVKSILITSTTLWYSYYFLIRTDEDKAYSYFEGKASAQTKKKRNCLYRSNTRMWLNHTTIGCLIFTILTNIVSKLKKRSLTTLLASIKSSHTSDQSPIYVSQSDLQLLDQWKCLLGGHKYYLGSLDTATVIMLFIALRSETTMFEALHQSPKQDQKDWTSRYFQFSDDKQEIEWSKRMESIHGGAPNIYTDLLLSQRGFMGLVIGLPTFILSYSFLPVSALCTLHVFKCGLNSKHRQECSNWVWCSKLISSIALAGCIFQGIINKLHFARYFAVREASIASYTRKDQQRKKKGKLKKLLSLRSFSYDMVSIVPWMCLYVSCVCGKASTYYIKTFASSSLFCAFKGKHGKNKYLLRVMAVSTLMMGVMVGLGNDTYFDSVKYAKRWFMNADEYCIESHKYKQTHTETETAGNECDQIEGGSDATQCALYQTLITGNYQQETEMLLSNRYFHQKAHDLFEYITEICVFLEDKLLNSLILPGV
eukprot:512941_1